MPISLADLKRGKRTLEVVVPEGTVNVTYLPGEVTQAAWDTVDRVLDLLVIWVESWDLTDNGEMYPVTEEALALLPQSFLGAVFDAIFQDTRERPTQRPGSFGAG